MCCTTFLRQRLPRRTAVRLEPCSVAIDLVIWSSWYCEDQADDRVSYPAMVFGTEAIWWFDLFCVISHPFCLDYLPVGMRAAREDVFWTGEGSQLAERDKRY